MYKPPFKGLYFHNRVSEHNCFMSLFLNTYASKPTKTFGYSEWILI